MEPISDALKKAQANLGQSTSSVIQIGASPPHLTNAGTAIPVAPGWSPAEVRLDRRHLERNRIVSFDMDDPAHIPFNMLRTRVRSTLAENNWRSVGITSPTPGCGKTMVAINLALSLARGGDVKTVLIDLDLKRPAVARTLGIERKATIGQFLLEKGSAEDCFVEIAQGLVVGLNGGHLPGSSELLQGPRMNQLLGFIHSALSPDVVVFDLPPLGGSDDVLAFLPRLDTTLLVAAAGQTTVAQIDECEQQLAEAGKFLGIVLNKSEQKSKDNYYY